MRRVWVVAKKDELEQADFNDAQANDCPEIANGIPPALADIITEGMLPCAYEEPAPEPIPEPIPSLSIHLARLDAVDPQLLRPVTVTRLWFTDDGVTTIWPETGKEYTYDCFVTQSMKDQWQAGEVVIGDFVLAHFLESDTDQAIVIANVFKTW